jgi:hypothetical protein
MKRFEISWRIFMHSLFFYLLLTLPSLLVPFIFAFSFLIAFIYGLIAVTVFWLCFTGLCRMDISAATAYQFVLLTVMVAVIFAFQVFGWTNNWILPGAFDADESVWDSGLFLALPFLAIIAGWIGVYRSRKRILKQLLTQPYDQHT